jgi:hypothetical protein
MNQHPPRRQTPAPTQAAATAATAADARKLAENLMDVMSALLGVIERETELVRAGRLREAMAFEPDKTELSRRSVEHAAPSSRRVSRHAADQPDSARDGARGVGERHPRRQHRDSAPQYSEYLHRRRPARGAGTAQHDADRGQPLALTGLEEAAEKGARESALAQFRIRA